MNKIELLVKVTQICNRFGATFQLSLKKPCVVTMPYAGAQTSEMVALIAEELHGFLGLWLLVDGRVLTFTVN